VVQKLKSQIRILKVCQRIASFLLSIVITATMAWTLAKYLQTRHTIADGESPWPTNTLLWPTIMLLAIAGTASLLYAGILLSYLFGGFEAANAATNFATVFTITFTIMKVSAWIAATVLYQVGNNTGRDVRSWSCGGSDNLNAAAQAVVNFNTICESNVSFFSFFPFPFSKGLFGPNFFCRIYLCRPVCFTYRTSKRSSRLSGW
jgi:hypothetical protein